MISGISLVLAGIGTLALFVFIYRFASKKSKEELELEMRLEEETIVVGEQHVTLEQAENGVVVSDEYRIRTVEEIEQLYEGDERELQLICRDLELLDTWADGEEVTALLKRAQQFQEYKEYYPVELCQYKPNLIIGLVSVTYDYQHGKTSGVETDVQAMIIVKDYAQIKRLRTIPDVIVEQVDSDIVLRQPKKARHLEFRHLVMEVEKLLR
jgi:hypothetical protein